MKLSVAQLIRSRLQERVAELVVIALLTLAVNWLEARVSVLERRSRFFHGVPTAQETQESAGVKE